MRDYLKPRFSDRGFFFYIKFVFTETELRFKSFDSWPILARPSSDERKRFTRRKEKPANMPLSIHEQIQKYSEAADGLRTDVSNAELEQLGKDIATHAEALWEYHKLIDADAVRLAEKAKEYAEAAKFQKTKSERIKEHLKYALKSNGFTKFKAGALQFTISETSRFVAKRPATENDFYTQPDFVSPKFSWKEKPNLQLWEELPDFVSVGFDWDIDKLQAAGKADLLEYDPITKLRVTVAREK